MAKAKKIKKAALKKKTGLTREIPTLHSLVTILYILLAILFIAMFASHII